MELKHYKRYCEDIENVENYEKAKADNFVGWCCHHRLQTWTSDGERRLVDIRAEELIALGMYWHRPASELIFMTESEHHSLHNKGEHNPNYGKPGPNKGKKFSEEHRKKIGEKSKGRCTMLGKHHSDESKKKIGEAALRSSKGRHWYNNGTINKFCYECPEGFVIGRLLIK